MMYSSILLAQAAPPADAKEKANEGPGWVQFTPFIAMAVLMYFLLIVPGRKEKQKRQELLNALKKNDEVLTNAGIIGIVASIKENGDEVTIKSDETRLRVLKSSIVRILNVKEEPKEQPKS